MPAKKAPRFFFRDYASSFFAGKPRSHRFCVARCRTTQYRFTQANWRNVMSNIAIIGATGRAGSQLLEEALRRGHSVTAIARDTSKNHPACRCREQKNVDVLDAAALQAAVAGHDAVISAAHFSTIPASAIIEPVKRAGVKTAAGGRRCRFAVAAGRLTGDRQRRLPRGIQGRGQRRCRVPEYLASGKRTWTGPSCRRRRSSSKVSAPARFGLARMTCW